MILSATWRGSFYVCLTEPPGFSHGEHQGKPDKNLNTNHNESIDKPQTGDNITSYITISLSSLVGLFFNNKEKFRNKNKKDK